MPHFSLQISRLTTTTKQTLLLFAVGVLLYLPSLGNPFIWDDEQFIYKNAFVTSFAIREIFTTSTTSGAGIGSDYYRPLTTLSFAWDHQWWGLNPIGFHLTNTVLHAGAGVLLYLFLRKIRLHPALSFWTALFFIIHPLQTESVVYANSRGDSLYTFFAFLTLLTYSTIFRKNSTIFRVYDRKITLNRLTLAVLTALLYLFTTLSKEIGIATIGLSFLTYFLLTYQIFSNKNGEKIPLSEKSVIFQVIATTKYQMLALGLQLGVAASYLYIRATTLNFDGTFSISGINPIYESSLLVRLLTFSKILWTYFRLLLVPFPLHMERDSEIITSISSPWPWLSLAVVVGILLIGWWEHKKHASVWWLYGWGWFFVMLVPVSGIIPINGLIYEHWLYVPQVGWWIALGSLALYTVFLNKKIHKKTRKKLRTFTRYCLIAVSIIFVILSLRQNYLWGDPVRFYEYTLHYSESARLYNNLGMAYAAKGNCSKAIESYEKSLTLSKYYPQTHHNIGNCATQLGDLEKGIKHYEHAIEIEPNFYYSYVPLLSIYVELNQKEKAYQFLDQISSYLKENESQMLKQELDLSFSQKEDQPTSHTPSSP